MIFNVGILIEDEAKIVIKNNLETWSNGSKTVYKSPKEAYFEGILLRVNNEKLQIKCSLHKVFYKKKYGVLDNTGIFTVSNANEALELLFNHIGAKKDNAKITYFEIGLNLPVKHEATKYIELMQAITTGKTSIKKTFGEDKNYKKNQQKTTEKSKGIKVVYKTYNKEAENAARQRKEPTGEHVLRLETMYRRQSISVTDFFKKENIDKLVSYFYRDWARVEFTRTMSADSGTRISEMYNAEKVLLLGAENYLQKAKEDFKNGKITEKQYRTVREFIRDWDSNKHKYKMLPSEYEKEYREALKYRFEIAKH